MSSTSVLKVIKDITARNAKAVREGLSQHGANQRYCDPKEQGLTYTLLHKAVEVGCAEVVSVLLAAGADVNAADSRGRAPLHWLADCSSSSEHMGVAGGEQQLLDRACDGLSVRSFRDSMKPCWESIIHPCATAPGKFRHFGLCDVVATDTCQHMALFSTHMALQVCAEPQHQFMLSLCSKGPALGLLRNRL